MRRFLPLCLFVLLSFAPQGWAADWTFRVENDATVTILHKNSAVVRVIYVAWGENWKWAHTQSHVGAVSESGIPFTGHVRALDLRWTGQIVQPAANVLKLHYRFEAQAERRNINGAGVEFQLTLDSPTLDEQSMPPVLLPRRRGWAWAVNARDAVRVSSDTSFASVYFDRGQRAKLRTMFYDGSVTPGAKEVVVTITLPSPEPEERSLTAQYGQLDTTRWFQDALQHDVAPVDLSYLNAADRPAGSRGFVRVDGERLLFGDGTPARFWGTNLAAAALFAAKADIEIHARRIAQFGFNLVRIHHHDSGRWVRRTVIDKQRPDTQSFDDEVMERLDFWIKSLKENGVYVWLDLHVGRLFKDGDAIEPGWLEIRLNRGDGEHGVEVKGFNYFNSSIEALMQSFNRRYLSHVNRYTQLAYKDDPAIMGLLVTNENDLTHHFSSYGVNDSNTPIHYDVMKNAATSFSQRMGLPLQTLLRTTEPGPSRIFLNDWERRFHHSMLTDLTASGVRVPMATTNHWGTMTIASLPALSVGHVIDAHVYGEPEALSRNPRRQSNFIGALAAAQVYRKPLTITEWNVPYPVVDRFTAPLYLMSVASLQGWDAPMHYNYSQRSFRRPTLPQRWTSYYDPALMAMMPAAAIAFRERHVKEASATYCYIPSDNELFNAQLSASSATAIRTLAERSRVTIGFPTVSALPWLEPSVPEQGVTLIDDIDTDFISAGQSFVESDTGELTRNWAMGLQLIDTELTQAAHGWIGAKRVRLKNVTTEIQTPKAAVAVTSLDNRAIGHSTKLLISCSARAVADEHRRAAFLSEPVRGRVLIRCQTPGLYVVPLAADGEALDAVPPDYDKGIYTVTLPAGAGTHWYMLQVLKRAHQATP